MDNTTPLRHCPGVDYSGGLSSSHSRNPDICFSGFQHFRLHDRVLSQGMFLAWRDAALESVEQFWPALRCAVEHDDVVPVVADLSLAPSAVVPERVLPAAPFSGRNGYV